MQPRRLSALQAAWQNANAVLFPAIPIHARRLSLRAQVAVGTVAFAAGFASARLLPPGGMIGFDWVVYFGHGRVDAIYPPWGNWVVAQLTWDSLIGLSVAGLTLAILPRAVHPISAIFALLTLPVFWVLLIGQLEGLIVLGLAGLPWLTPLALLKPQVATFAFGSRARHVLAFGIWLLLSLLVWGSWPERMFGVHEYIGEGRLVTDVSLGFWGLPLALALAWLARGDPDHLMLSGAFATLYLLPYNLLPAMPAVARLRPAAAALAMLLSWLPVSANWLGPSGWWLTWFLIAFLWLGLAAKRYPHVAPHAWWRRIFVGGQPA